MPGKQPARGPLGSPPPARPRPQEGVIRKDRRLIPPLGGETPSSRRLQGPGRGRIRLGRATLPDGGLRAVKKVRGAILLEWGIFRVSYPILQIILSFLIMTTTAAQIALDPANPASIWRLPPVAAAWQMFLILTVAAVIGHMAAFVLLFLLFSFARWHLPFTGSSAKYASRTVCKETFAAALHVVWMFLNYNLIRPRIISSAGFLLAWLIARIVLGAASALAFYLWFREPLSPRRHLRKGQARSPGRVLSRFLLKGLAPFLCVVVADAVLRIVLLSRL